MKKILPILLVACAIISAGVFSARAEDGTPDTTPPVITLIGDSTVYYLEGETYEEEGATVHDDRDGLQGQINGTLTISGDVVDSPYAGTYPIYGDISGFNFVGNIVIPSRAGGFDPSGSWTYTWGMLNGDYYVNTGFIQRNGTSEYLFYYYFHGDEIRGTIWRLQNPGRFIGSFIVKNPLITGQVSGSIRITSGVVDTSKPGTYYVRYNAKDKAGNAAHEVARTVVVAPLSDGNFDEVLEKQYAESPELSDSPDHRASDLDLSTDDAMQEQSSDEGIDHELATRLSGRIVLQVERHGEAWYVHEGRKHYMPDGTAAYQLMRFYSLGIADNDLAQIPSESSIDTIRSAVSVCSSNGLARRVRGRILLQVQQKGEAWYVHPDNCRRIYMKDGATAYSIMRFLSLGITDSDLAKVPE